MNDLQEFELPSNLKPPEPQAVERKRRKRGPRRSLAISPGKLKKPPPKRPYVRRAPVNVPVKPFDLMAALLVGQGLSQAEAEFVGSCGKMMQNMEAGSRKKVLVALNRIFA